MFFTATRYGTENPVEITGEYANVQNFIKFRLAKDDVEPGAYKIVTPLPNGTTHQLTDAYKRADAPATMLRACGAL